MAKSILLVNRITIENVRIRPQGCCFKRYKAMFVVKSIDIQINGQGHGSI